MSAPRPRPLNEERPFSVEELFFSTTDAKGLIRHGNGVFTRVSGYAEDDLIGAPHNIIRHPDMPRSVFQILWDYIQSGRTIAAYVKNLAKDGCFYWVLATVMPCPGGYLSVRLKPSSSFFEKAKLIYQNALAVEREIETDPSRRKEAIAAGVESLVNQISAAGFASYDDFMQQALSAELASRRDALDRLQSGRTERDVLILNGTAVGELSLSARCRRIQRRLEAMFSSLEQLKLLQRDFAVSAEQLQSLSTWIQNASLNATITSARLGAVGRVLAEIARLLRDSAGETIVSISDLSNRMEGISSRLGRVAFDVAVTELQVETCVFFAAELADVHWTSQSPEDLHQARTEESLDILLGQLDRRTEAAYSAVADMCDELGHIRGPIARLSRLLSEMRMIQFSGRKESLAHPNGREFAIVFEDVGSRVKDSTKVCMELMESIDTCETTLAAGVEGRGVVAQELQEIRLATCSVGAL